MIKKVVDVLGNRLLYICILIITLLFDTILLVHNYTGPLIKIFLIWGIFVIFWDLIHGHKLWQIKPMFLLIIFCCLYWITSIVNSDVYFMANVKTLAYMLTFFLILYGHDKNMSMNLWKKEIKTVMKIYVITTAILSSICLFTYIFQLNIEFLTVDGYMHLGMSENRLWGLYNPNIGGGIEYLSIVFSLALLFMIKKGEKHGRIVLGVNILLQYVCLLLTSSRTSLYVFLLCIGGIAFFSLNFKSEKFSFNTIKGLCANVIVSMIIMMSVYAIGDLAKNVMVYVPGYVKIDISEPVMDLLMEAGLDDVKRDTTNSIGKDKIELTRLEVLENREGGMLTGRVYIWNAGLKAWKKSPIFGISKNAIFDYSKEYIKDKQWLIPMETSLHNGYITILVASGILGAVIFAVFLILNLVPMIKTAFVKKKSENYILYIVCLGATLSFLLAECFEARIVYRTEIFTAMFWILCGFTYNYVEIINNNKALENKEDIHERA